MTDDGLPTDLQATIDRGLAATLARDGGTPVRVARAAVLERDDRWYGRLLVGSYAAASESSEFEPALSAAAAIELLRGYCRLRSGLFDRLRDSGVHDPTEALLAGDLLYSAAYSALGRIDGPQIGACFEVLTGVSETVVEAFAIHHGRSRATADTRDLIDGTAGALGRGGAAIGATLAGVDGSERDRFATLGGGLGASRGVRLSIGSEAGNSPACPPNGDEQPLRRHATRRLAEADRALDALSLVDETGIRSLFDDATVPASE